MHSWVRKPTAEEVLEFKGKVECVGSMSLFILTYCRTLLVVFRGVKRLITLLIICKSQTEWHSLLFFFPLFPDMAWGSPLRAQLAPWGLNEGNRMYWQHSFVVLLIGLDHCQTGSDICIILAGNIWMAMGGLWSCLFEEISCLAVRLNIALNQATRMDLQEPFDRWRI